MDSYEELTSAGDTQPALPNHLARKFCAQSQLDFEVEFFGAILALDPNNIEVLRVMGNNLIAKGDHAGGLDVDQRLVRLCPHDPVAYYNLACSYSLLQMIDSALAALERAIELGYDEFDFIREDRDLEAARKDPRFQDILESHGIA